VAARHAWIALCSHPTSASHVGMLERADIGSTTGLRLTRRFASRSVLDQGAGARASSQRREIRPPMVEAALSAVVSRADGSWFISALARNMGAFR
jgi:hypothetical protein